MKEHIINSAGNRPAGYEALIARFSLEVLPNWHRSFVAAGNTHRVNTSKEVIEELYAARYWPGDSLGDQLQFALKYDGTNLAILNQIFKVAPIKEIKDYIESAPRGKYVRRIWYLYEILTSTELPIADLKTGGYIDLLDSQQYYTTSMTRSVRRQRINDNLLGESRFCPVIRRTDTLRSFEEADLPSRSREIIEKYPPKLLKRAMNYLYTKESKSSFEIEQINPTSTRTERFVALLQLAEKEDFFNKEKLIDLQNRIVDPRFRDKDYRESQNYVGETVAWQKEKIHFVSPKPQDLTELMEGLLAAHERMEYGEVSPVIHAAVSAYGFVFLHPFEDGNGRIHRFLIHNILARRKFTPSGLIFPVSASMLQNMVDYDASLEAFSKPLMPLVEYELDEMGRMTVKNDTATCYRFPDMTPQAEALFHFIQKTIDGELTGELSFLANYDQTKQDIQNIVDLPDREIDLFIRFCLQNNGTLSARKRKAQFPLLTDEEIELMENSVQSAYG